MKKILVLSLLLLTIQFSFSQNRFKPSTENISANDHVIFPNQDTKAVNVSIIDQSKVPNSEKNFFYLLEVKNTTNRVKNYQFEVENIDCNLHKEHSDFNFNFYNTSKTNELKELVVEPGKTKKFYVKTNVPENAKSFVWNCKNILLHNPITNEKEVTRLVSQVQDPKNVH